MNVGVKLDPWGIMPEREHDTDAGMDIMCPICKGTGVIERINYRTVRGEKKCCYLGNERCAHCGGKGWNQHESA